MRPLRLLVCSAFVFAATADAQWLNLPTPGLPRLPDGKPDLTAPAPRMPDGRPDLSGLWNNDGGDRYNNNIAADLAVSDVAPWAHALIIKEDPNPTWMGYSVGHWEGDVLVVESNGYNDRSWLDFGGHPHTEALRNAIRGPVSDAWTCN